MNKIHVIFKTHLDVGFTDLASRVVSRFFEEHIPRAIDLAESLEQQGDQDRFIWTTGSWLIYEYLEQASPRQRARLEAAIHKGYITWHGLPFTTHSELLDVDLFRFGLSLSQELDQRFGRRTIAAKMSDVPGHTRGIVPLLAEAGIEFLHLGVNPACTAPDVPPVFVWTSPEGAEIIVMIHQGSYGDFMSIPGLEEAIAFAHTGDNLGPQSAQDVRGYLAGMRQRFPGACVMASTLDAFAAALRAVKRQLPVLTSEIGDTWIHGVGSDPAKVAQYRALVRLRRRWLAEGRLDPSSESCRAFSRSLLLVAEHTWGLDVKTHLADFENYEAQRFRSARPQRNFRKLEESWAEQRAYVEAAVGALAPSPLGREASVALETLTPVPPVVRGSATADGEQAFETPRFRLAFGRHGALVSLVERDNGREWASDDHPLGLLCYETFSQDDYDRFYQRYVINKRQVAEWAVPDLTKPGIAAAGAEHNEWQPTLTELHHDHDAHADRFVLRLTMPPICSRDYGCPRDFTLEVTLPEEKPIVGFDLRWFGKPACRLPEALWFSFCPLVSGGRGWRLDKLGQWISPREVVRNGNRKLHGVGQGVVHHGRDGDLFLDTWDAPLVAPDRRSLLEFDNQQPSLHGAMHFLLYNNVWGTNFPMWYDDDARFRFMLRIEAGQPHD